MFSFTYISNVCKQKNYIGLNNNF